MAFNLLKRYNDLLELDGLDERARNKSLTGIFNRDFINSPILFRGNTVDPTPKEGEDVMGVLFNHLTRRDYDKTGCREYDRNRAMRLHWVKHHISEITPKNIDVFSVNDPSGVRTYIFDRAESYVVVLEPRKRRGNKSYFLITAYHVSEKGDFQKIERKSQRRLSEIV